MHWQQKLIHLFLLAVTFTGASQVPLTPSVNVGARSWLSRPWNERPSEDAMGNLVFQSLSSLMQMMPNSKHPFGHSIVRAIIPKGTLLYHGTFLGTCPSMDWMALDAEHAMIFTFGANGTLFTYTTTRDIQLVYFDGCSGNDVPGVIDTQDLLIWGEPGRRGHRSEDWMAEEVDRLVDGCAWAKQHGIDGFLRMEFDFEIMYCDLTQGLKLVSSTPTVNPWANYEPTKPSMAGVPESRAEDPRAMVPPQGPRLPSDQCSPEATFHGLTKARLTERNHRKQGQTVGNNFPPYSYPNGWKGNLPVLDLEAFHAGTWHNQFPGEPRVYIDHSSMITLFDPSLTSLVEARRSMTRDEYRAANLSKADITHVRADIAEVMARDPFTGSGVDWQGLARVIQERFADRLPFMQHLLHQPEVNVTAQLTRVRRQLIISLIPYMHRENVGEPEWFAEIAHRCAARFTDHLPRAEFTKQERVLHHATEEVLHEVCRVYTEAWVEAFDAEEKSIPVVQGYLEKWKGQFDSLVAWLDWPVWIKCDPPCGVDEVCRVSQGAPWDPDSGHEPRCMPIDLEKFVFPPGSV
ncbi:hypothetical protein DAEQUDRAFT_697780 [Daedalea quercina L-15889]|uniref:Uncharacterized protein n=1 Tax=Daedalea quercina L-15889 TaxID=1314783 RepID=A0A165LYP0_9APHY|nr:hypothetical protein DAEQUDRAFT_697780 [Daedalea quercina L-15889]